MAHLTTIGNSNNVNWVCNAVPPSMRGLNKPSVVRNSFNSLFSLTNEKNLRGMDLLNAKFHNACMCYVNPFAAVEYKNYCRSLF